MNTAKVLACAVAGSWLALYGAGLPECGLGDGDEGRLARVFVPPLRVYEGDALGHGGRGGLLAFAEFLQEFGGVVEEAGALGEGGEIFEDALVLPARAGSMVSRRQYVAKATSPLFGGRLSSRRSILVVNQVSSSS